MVMLKKTKGLTWPFWALALATTLLYLAGLAALQYSCSFIPTVQATPGIFGRSAFGASDFQCHRMFRFYWFIFAFVMATLLGLIIAAALKLALHFSRPFWVGMITISIVLMMIASEFFLGHDNAFDATSGWPWWLHARWRVATAGAIASVVSLVLLLLAIGTDWDRYGHGSHHSRDEKMTGRHDRYDRHMHTTTEQVAVPVGNVRVVDQV